MGACCALELARSGAKTVLLERETEVCPPVSGAHANCGLLVPSDATPLAAPGVLGQGLRWMLDSSSPFYIAPRPSPALARWLWLFRAACSAKRAQAAAPVLRALHVESARLHDELAADHGGERWHFHHGGELQIYETAAGLAEAAEEVEAARALGALADEMTAAEARRLFPSLQCDLAGAFLFPEDGHLDPLRFTQAVAGLAADAGATVVTGAEALSLEPAARRSPRPDHSRRVRRRPGGAGGRRLDPVPHARPRLPPARRTGQGLQRRRRPSRRLPRAAAVPGRRPRRADAAGGRAASGQHAGALRVGHARASQASGLPERGRPASASACRRTVRCVSCGAVRGR